MAGRLLLGLCSFGAYILPLVLASTCKYVPGDKGWPSDADWAHLNTTVGGRLIATIPQASVCHTSPYDNYNETECDALAAGWHNAETFLPHPAEIMNPYWQNQSCDPFTPTSQPCRLGNYASYSINVTNADDVRAGIQFAKENNIRLAVKTTGHDYIARSSGKGTLSLWMRNLQTAEPIPHYKSSFYNGPAMKLGSGMSSGYAYEVAYKAGLRVVGGECASVGVAAGYTMGGGHSLLTTAYGMAADQVLEWEVVTADGEHLIATPEKNKDLYWALSGGGGGTFAVALSMTARAYPEGPVAGGSLSFDHTAENDAAFSEAVALWIRQAPALAAENNTVIWVIANSTFSVYSLTLPDQPESAVAELLGPFLGDLDRLGIEYTFESSLTDSYRDHFERYYGPLPYGEQLPTTNLQSRLIPRAVVASENATDNLVDVIKTITEDDRFLIGCIIINATDSIDHPDNAVLPAWRDAAMGCNINGYWDFDAPLESNLAIKRLMGDVHIPALEAATPGSGIYANEMDPFYQGDWKKTIWGKNYDRLLKIKHKVDPDHIFWGGFTVGADNMFLDKSGRLCKA